MHHRVEPVRPERRIKRLGIADIRMAEGAPSDEAAMPHGQIVEHHGRVAAPGQRLRGVAADISGASDDQYRGDRALPAVTGYTWGLRSLTYEMHNERAHRRPKMPAVLKTPQRSTMSSRGVN